ncbi:type II secretion system protein [Verrucomicrobiota bacterium]
MKTHARSGFTLLELLVVITIIGILVGLLFPVFGRIRMYARSAQCASNLRQLHTAATGHKLKYGGLPHGASFENRQGEADGNGNWSWTGWKQWGTGWVDWYFYNYSVAETDTGTGQHGGDLRTYWWGDEGITCITNGTLYPFARGLGIYLCPEFYRQSKKQGWAPSGVAVRSYAFRAGGDLTGKNASRTILFADGAYHENCTVSGVGQIAERGLRNDSDNNNGSTIAGKRWYHARDGQLDWGLSGNNRPWERVGCDHMGKGNAVFRDGHVESILCTDTYKAAQGDDWGEY